MNLLQLTQSVAFRSRTVPGLGQPAAITGLTGRQARCLDWTKWAWREIQTRRKAWNWMRRDFTGAALNMTQTYEPSDWIASRFGSWVIEDATDSGWTIYLDSEGVSDERYLTYCPWEDFRTRIRGSQEDDYPALVSIDPRKRVWLHPRPDDDYTVKGQYVLAPQELSDATDTPEIDEKWHDLIVLHALVLLHESDEAAFLDPRTRAKAQVMMSELEIAELPSMGMAGSFTAGGGPLA